MMRLSTVAITSGTSKVPSLIEIEIIGDWLRDKSVAAEELAAKGVIRRGWAGRKQG